MKYLYCEKCEDLVPETEVKNPFPTLKDFKPIHYYTRMVNAYKNQAPGVIGFCPETEHNYCGSVREPTPEEYFIHYTCNPDRNQEASSTMKSRGPEKESK